MRTRDLELQNMDFTRIRAGESMPPVQSRVSFSKPMAIFYAAAGVVLFSVGAFHNVDHEVTFQKIGDYFSKGELKQPIGLSDDDIFERDAKLAEGRLFELIRRNIDPIMGTIESDEPPLTAKELINGDYPVISNVAYLNPNR
jgi:hypothetical protein